MKLAVTLKVHGDTECVLDTIEAIQHYVTNDILVIVDGTTWENWGRTLDLPVYKMSGFYHTEILNCPACTYRNTTLGLMHTVKLFPDVDWYCCTEYDVLFTSDGFKKDLEIAEEDGVWCMGNDCRVGDLEFPIIEKMLKTKIHESRYLLGCCVFHHRDFLHKLKDINFFNRFLYLTNDFEKGFFPGHPPSFSDLTEHLYPTLAHHFGGKVRGQATFDEEWYGNYEKYPMRWQPGLDPKTELFPDAYIMHPVKAYDSPIRTYHREKRK